MDNRLYFILLFIVGSIGLIVFVSRKFFPEENDNSNKKDPLQFIGPKNDEELIEGDFKEGIEFEEYKE